MASTGPGRWILAALFVGMILAWGFNFIFVRIGLASSPPLWLAMLRAVLATGGVAVGLLLWRSDVPLNSQERRDALLLGLPTTALFFGLWFDAATQVPPGKVAVIVYTFPLWVVVLSSLLLSQRESRWIWLGVVTGFLGIVLLEEPWTGGAGHLPPVAVAELLAAAFCWAVGTVGLKTRIRGPALRTANGYQLMSGAAVLVVAAIVLEPHPTILLTESFVLSVLFLALVGTAFANVAWFALLERFPASTLSTWAFLTPVVALVASILIFGELLDAIQILGVVAVLGGAAAVARTEAGTVHADGSRR